MVSTKYLLRYKDKEKKGKEMSKRRTEGKRKKIGDGGCAFAQRSHTTRDLYLLSKLKAPGLSTKK